MAVNRTKITKEMIDKAVQCKTADELIALAKKEGIAITKAEAEAYMTELEDIDLSTAELEKIAGGDGHDLNCPRHEWA